MDEVRRLRKLKGLTQVELAELAGVSAYTITEIETGHREPRPSTLRKLAGALGVEVADFFPKARRSSPIAAEDQVGEGHVELYSDPAKAAAAIGGLGDLAVNLAAGWNRDVELYERHGHDMQPYRAFEMSAAVIVLYQHFWGALRVLQGLAGEQGLDPDPATWDAQSRQKLREALASIRALAELYEVIDRSTATSGIDQENFRAMREEFDVSTPTFLANDPRWPEAVQKTRAAVGLA